MKESSSRGAKSSEVVVDRFEGETAVLLFPDGRIAYLPRSSLPAEALPGKRLILDILLREAE